MKPLKIYEVAGFGVFEVEPHEVDPTDPLYVECPFCPVLVPWNSTGRYNLSLVRRRTVTDEESRIRPLCLDCSHEVSEAEYLAEQEAAQSEWEAIEDARRWA